MLTDKEQEEIRRKLLALEEEPPTGAWSKIVADIRPQQEPRSPWWHAAAALLLLLLSSAGVYYFTTQQASDDTAIVSIEQEQRQEESSRPYAGERDRGLAAENQAAVSVDTAPLEVEVTDNVGLNAPAKATPKNNQPAVEPIRTEKPKVIAQREAAVPVSRSITTVVVDDVARADRYSRSSMAASDIAPSAASTADVLKGRIPILVNSEPFDLSETPAIALELKPIHTPSQHTTSDHTNPKQSGDWYLSMAVAPRYTFRSFKPAVEDEVYITKLQNLDRLDPERMGYELGLNAGKAILPALYLETSLSVMRLRENVSYSYTTGKVDTILKSLSSDGTIRAIPVYAIGERHLRSSYTYGGLRLGATYFFMERAQRRFNLTVSGGVNLLLKGRTEELVNGELLGTVDFPDDDNPLEQTNYNLMLGVGYNMALHRQYELMVMPTVNYFLGSTYSNREPFGMRPYSIGMSFQIRRRFGK
ncbi:hypothetical protein [uncultured Pontibacter sp.]|uniref:hypothetical protein n=1 Tax=uncultured Pontibacter sp. TaxID=453356 RepID=UPI00260FEF10|nr:hypothetical protein [uncultured Pontibacter sp.]